LPVSRIILERFSVAEFVADLRGAGELSAASQHCTFVVSDVDPELAVEADRDLLLAAVGNLLQNGFKFTQPGTAVTLNAYAIADQVLIDVKDHCGGLKGGASEEMFTPFKQLDGDRSGLGLGLSIARRSVTLNGGHLHARDIPGEGCIFTISLPRLPLLSEDR
jgi:signal transduction histidine kinase